MMFTIQIWQVAEFNLEPLQEPSNECHMVQTSQQAQERRHSIHAGRCCKERLAILDHHLKHGHLGPEQKLARHEHTLQPKPGRHAHSHQVQGPTRIDHFRIEPISETF